ncbi:MAG: 50S ribosomal protein L21 [Bacteroidetes bacterium]|nr:50S ribosomal protein L21 [Bacteroidota bacterium]MCA0447118.1 50S ribosomal protein L21 [Bacteroidota bacterium]
MYAIVEIAGKQFKVEGKRKVYVPLLDKEIGAEVSFDQVLLVDDGSKVTVGAPTVKNASIEATVLAHVKADKIRIFKYKRRKGYRKHMGHRQNYTQILVNDIKV